MKKIRILIEIPEKWVDYEDPVFGLGSFVSDRFEVLLKDAIVQQALKKIQLPTIKIASKEVKDKILTILAERVLEE